MPQLDPTWFISQLFWLAVSFVTLYVMLSRWALPRIQGTMTLRQETVSSDLASAKRMTAQAEHAKQDYERTLADARARAQQLFADAMASHKAKADSAEKAMDVQTASMLAEGRRKIDAQKQSLMQALTPTSAELADMIVHKLTGKAIGRDVAQSSVNDILKTSR